MVLASNEWLNNSDDDQKSETSSNVTDTNAAAARELTDNSNRTEVITNSQQQSPETIATAADNANVEQINQTTTTEHQQQQKQETDLQQNIQLMAEKRPINEENKCEGDINETNKTNENEENEEKLKEDIKHVEVEPQRNEELLEASSLTTTTNNTSSHNEINSPSSHINNKRIINATLLDDFLSEEIVGSSSTVDSNLNTNSNSNTLQGSLTVRLQQSNPPPPPPNYGPITPQALSSALQSVMSSTPNSNITSASQLQASILSSLTMGAALQFAGKKVGRPTFKPNLDSDINLNLGYLTNTNLTNNNNNSSVLDNNDAIASDCNGQPKIVLLCETNSHPFQTRTITLTPNVECKVGRLIAKGKASESNAIFDCKVLSRNHAVLWYSDDGKFWVKDTKSSNGTFINDNKLGNEASELHFGDIVKFGVDVLENSRKEVHGCIIACVKLYSPDGREAITIDGGSSRISQYSGDGRISFEELHRLNSFMQEAAQREKLLKSKLLNMQNILDATRKNSNTCWKSMIAEDQLLHRINWLENKLQFMEKNVSESTLRNEVLKLLDDKNAYQQTAKEALRKVYQERCDAMQMLTKMETAYSNSEKECQILREQIMSTQHSMTDLTTRLQCLEFEYNEFKDAAERQQQEAKEQEEKHLAERNEKLAEYEMECEQLKQVISQLKKNELLDEEKMAFEKLDAALADEDDGDDDEDDDDVVENAASDKEKIYQDIIEIDVNSTQQSSPKSMPENANLLPSSTTKQKGFKESTIRNWLQNSDLNNEAGSNDIFNAICNQSSDSSDENDECEEAGGAGTTNKNITSTSTPAINGVAYEKLCCALNKLKIVQQDVKQWEIDVLNQSNKSTKNDDNNSCELIMKMENGKTCVDDNKIIAKVQKAVERLVELAESMKQIHLNNTECVDEIEVKDLKFRKTHVEVQEIPITKVLQTQETLKPLAETNEDSDEYDDEDEDSTRLSVYSQNTVLQDLSTQSGSTNENTPSVLNLCYEQQVKILQEQLKESQRIENEAQHNLEILHMECETDKDQIASLKKLVNSLSESKQVLEQIVTQNKSMEILAGEISNENFDEKVTVINTVDVSANTSKALEDFEQQISEELQAMNSNVMQREEELIIYKERLEHSQYSNLELRKEVEQLKHQMKSQNCALLLKQVLPYGAVVVAAILLYLLISYF